MGQSQVKINETKFSDWAALVVIPHMNGERAAFVRLLRCKEDYTWRAVGNVCGREWGEDWFESQDIGYALCRVAAALLNENPEKDPW